MPDAARLAQAATVAGFRAAWRVVRLLPAPAAYRAFDAVAHLTYRRDSRDVRRLRATYRRVRPDLDGPALETEVREGVRSYLRYWCDAFRLPDIDAVTLADSVHTLGDEPVRAALARGKGVVMFLGHTGSWDLAGAWSTTHLAPVTTVAERLEPEDLFDEFVAFREGLGMTILPLTGGGPVFPRLVRTLRAGGFVPLLADRDLTGSGVVVPLAGVDAHVAVGPAALARGTGAALHPVMVSYVPRRRPGGTGSGHDLRIEWGPRVEPVDGPDGLVAMTAACTSWLGERIAADPRQWHMMQRVFAADVDDRAASGTPTGQSIGHATGEAAGSPTGGAAPRP